MTDNHWSYTRSASLAALLSDHEIKHRLIKPHCPWQNGKVCEDLVRCCIGSGLTRAKV